MRLRLALLAACACAASCAGRQVAVGAGEAGTRHAATEKGPASGPGAIAARVAGLTRWDGFLPVAWDEREGKLLLEVPRPGEDLLYLVWLATGVGSNALGLDRGQLDETRLVRFERVGAKVLLVQPNLAFRAEAGSPSEQRAVSESFASSVLWSFPLLAESDGRLLVDATEFFLRDAHGVGARLREAQQGSYAVDAARCAPHLPRTRAFPRNTEVEATITLATKEKPGPLLASVTPTPEALTVRQHHSFVRLPDPGYRPRPLDPRAGFVALRIADYATPFAEPLERWLALRHRLRRPSSGGAVEPIVYYVDHAVPEPIRGALVEGASWWKEAFAAAGFPGAYDVRILPEDADPLDVRWNVVQWVHRSTRGWSYGAAVVDPRTGEILKGHVSLGSLRIRQDLALASALVGPYASGDPDEVDTLGPGRSPSALALARIRQLAAHEVGHTLGLAHNFAASANGRASVMDYPPPRVLVREGRLDLSEAYARGLGDWDRLAIRWGYTEFPPGADEPAGLRAIVREGIDAGLRLVGHDDAMGSGTGHPLGAVWDDGDDPVEGLRRAIEVRRVALDGFGLGNLRPGQPLADLEPLFLLAYLHHRYAVEAALKSLGGEDFSYAIREPSGPDRGRPVPSQVRRVVDPGQQRAALSAALATLEPAFLAVPQRIRDLLPPPASGGGTVERFARATAGSFDPVAAVRAAAAVTLGPLLHPARAARLDRHHAEDPRHPALAEVTTALVSQLTKGTDDPPAAAVPRRAVRDVAVARLQETAAASGTDPAVRAAYEAALRELASRLRSSPGRGEEAAARRSMADSILRFLDRPAQPRAPDAPVAIPQGPPI